ncbi:MAG: AI-2E family transporter [Candidatus Poriferisodalaceae bacterium]|nr:MAG: AI-2E family transporter [Acidimicrobiales bacterium MED-G01]
MSGRAEKMPQWVPRATAVFLGGATLLAALVWMLFRVRSLIIVILVSLFLSFAIEPAVNWLARRGWRRGPATLSMFALILLAVGGFLYAMGSVLADQITKLTAEAPGYIREIEEWLEARFGIVLETDALVAEFSSGGSAARLASNIAGDLVSIGTALMSLIFQTLTVLLFTFYLVADGPKLRRLLCSALSPKRQALMLKGWEIAIDKTGAYIYSRTLLGLAAFLVHWLVFALLGVPSPVPLALWVGIMSQFVPVAGTYLAGLLPILIALLNEPISALWVLLAIAIYQQLENYLFAPRITSQTMNIHPAVAFGTVILGASLLGVVGTLLAVPAAATVQAFVSTYIRRHELIDSDLLDDDGLDAEETE